MDGQNHVYVRVTDKALAKLSGNVSTATKDALPEPELSTLVPFV